MKSFLLTLGSCLFFSVIVSAQNPVGNWEKPCQDNDGDMVLASLKIEAKGSQVSWQETEIGYEEAECKIPYIKFDKLYSAILSSENVDLSVIDVSYTPLTLEVANALNEAQFCEISSWKLNKQQSILNKICADIGNYMSGEKVYSIFKMTGAELYVGTSSEIFNGSSPAKRHLQLQRIAFSKKTLR